MTPQTPEAIRQAARQHAAHVAALASARKWLAKHPPNEQPAQAEAERRWGSLPAINRQIMPLTGEGSNVTT